MFGCINCLRLSKAERDVQQGARIHVPVARGWILILCVSVFSACSLSTVKAPSLGFLYGYESVIRDYKAGRIMEARNTVLHMDKSRPDYANARTLLKKKIEPARLRLLRHYVRAAKRAEKAGTWFQAKSLYEQAASFSIHNAALLRKVRNLDLRMRQIRMDKLIAQRRKEDSQLLSSFSQYNVPKGLSPRDDPFSRQRKNLERRIVSRARNSYLAAKREMRNGYPEVAYVEIESFRRLKPGAARGKTLMSGIRKALPKGLRIPSTNQPVAKINPIAIPKTVTAGDIQELIKKGKWLKAKSYVVVYQREGGKHADRLLNTIEKNMTRRAASAFKAGRIAFRLEHLDKAVENWKQAVALRPDNTEYSHNLNRALQLQERLRILRSKADAEEKNAKAPASKIKPAVK